MLLILSKSYHCGFTCEKRFLSSSLPFCSASATASAGVCWPVMIDWNMGTVTARKSLLKGLFWSGAAYFRIDCHQVSSGLSSYKLPTEARTAALPEGLIIFIYSVEV